MDGERSALEGLVDQMLEGMADHRVAAVLRGPLAGDLRAFLDRGFLSTLRERLGDEAALLEGMPGDLEGGAAAAVDWVRDERPEAAPRVAESVAVLLGAFVAARRADVVQAMGAAGEAPGRDREGRMARAEEGLDRAAGALRAVKTLPGESDEKPVDALLHPAVEALEAARDLLEEVALDDGILGVPEGAVPARERLREAWLAEADLNEAAAGRVGPEAAEGEAVEATPEQMPYLLDAIVALQEALTLRADPAGLLRLARLRVSKQDVGEARVILQRVLEMDLAEAERAQAEGLLEKVGAAPAGRDRRCFVATAALSPDAPEVEALRAWRDAVLMPRRPGRLLVAAYYRLSPPLARAVADRPALRRAVRDWLVRPLARAVSRR